MREFSSLDEVAVYRDLWHRATCNMPASNDNTFHLSFYLLRGQKAALKHCLGLTNDKLMNRCGKPDPEMDKALKKYAGPNGTFLARVKLTNLGIAHRYKYWPNP